METDRGAVLTVRAAVAGVIDFTQARLRDVGWWRRANLLIRALHREQSVELKKAAYAYQCALVGNGSLDDNSFKEVQAEAKRLYNELSNAARPWAAKTLGEIQQEEIGGLIDLYKKVIGDPSDPAFQARLRENIRRLEQERQVAEDETEEQRVDRLVEEHKREQERRLRAAQGKRR